MNFKNDTKSQGALLKLWHTPQTEASLEAGWSIENHCYNAKVQKLLSITVFYIQVAKLVLMPILVYLYRRMLLNKR